MTTEERFWAKVERVGGCLLWTACLYSNGYGMFWDGQRNVRAHRFAYELKYGPIPEGLDCLHNCPGGDNRRCVNWEHLFLGTKKDNHDDAVRKGRIAPFPEPLRAWAGKGCKAAGIRFGEDNPAAQMNERQVLTMRALHARGMHTREIAAWFDMPERRVKNAVYRQTWTHLP